MTLPCSSNRTSENSEEVARVGLPISCSSSRFPPASNRYDFVDIWARSVSTERTLLFRFSSLPLSHVKSLVQDRIAREKSLLRSQPSQRKGARMSFDLAGMSEPRSPANYSNFVHEQNDHGRQRNPDAQRVASEEIQRHACPARASSY